MPGRQNTNITASESYRYAYNGMEQDNEVSGNGNSYTTEFRQYDPRLGRWKSLDPLMAQFPWQSPYCAFDNNPIFYTDLYGLSAGGPDGDTSDPPVTKEDGSDWEIGDTYYDHKFKYTFKGKSENGDLNWVANRLRQQSEVSVRAKKIEHFFTTEDIKESDLSSEQRSNLRNFAYSHPESTIEFPYVSSHIRGHGVMTFGPTPSGLRSGNILSEFRHGTGPEYSIFLSDHPITISIRKDIEEIDRLKSLIYDKFAGDINKLKEEAANRDGAIYTNFQAYGGTFLPNDEDLNSVGQFIGTFSADVFYDASTNKITFHVIDSKSRSSLYYHLFGNIPRKKGERTPEGNTYQKYVWSEDVESLENWGK